MIDKYDLASTFESQAEWRREKAEQYPDDAERNLLAAKTFDVLATQAATGDFDAEIYRRYSDLVADEETTATVCGEELELNRQVGFWSFPNSVDEYLAELLDRVERVAA